MLNQTPKTIKTQGNGQTGSFHIEWFSDGAMRQKDTPNGQFETPPEYGLAPCVGAVRLPKPGADLAWSAPGWDFPPSARRSRPGGWNSSSVKVESRPTERTLRERSVMGHQVLTKSGAVASIKGRVSLRKGAVRFRPPTSHRRIVMSNQDVS